MKKLNFNFKKCRYGLSVLGVCVFFISIYSCEKSDWSSSGSKSEQGVKLYSTAELLTADTAFVALDSTDTVRTFTVYDLCRNTVGTLTTSSKKLYFSGQTTSTVTITGTSSLTLDKGSNYYFKPNGCSSGNYILKVKFNTGTQTFCNYFKLTTCTWSAIGSCSIVNSYSFVGTLPTPC